MEPQCKNTSSSIFLSPITTETRVFKHQKSSMDDLISELPDCLVHHILSFLDMKFVVPTCVLSQRWKHLYKSLPFMNFNQKVYNQSMEAIGAKPRIDDFIEFVGKVLQLHHGSVLQISLLCVDDRERRLPALKLPTCIFTSKTLTNLKLDMGKKGLQIFELPDSLHLPCVKNLHLGYVLIRNLGSFISSCPVLETLCIDGCIFTGPNNFNISALKLRKLDMFALLSVDVHSITLYAPNLDMLSWSGLNYLSTLHIPSLVTGEIVMISHFDVRMPSENPRKKRATENVLNCLSSFANAKDLSVTDLLVELAMEPGSRLGSTITSFSNLTILRMVIFHSVHSIRTVSSLLVKCPNLERLELTFRKLRVCHCFDETKFEFEDGEEGNSEAKFQPQIQCMSSFLKTVKIEGSLCNIYELELVKFFLKNATVLEKMCVSTFIEDEDRCDEYKKKIELFPRASSNVHIAFL